MLLKQIDQDVANSIDSRDAAGFDKRGRIHFDDDRWARDDIALPQLCSVVNDGGLFLAIHPERVITHLGSSRVSVTLWQFRRRQIQTATQRDRAQVHDFMGRIHVEGEQSQMLFIKALQYTFYALFAQRIGGDRQWHFKGLTGITDVDFELAGDLVFGNAVVA